MRSLIDINCDMGEGMPNDALIMPFISSANIACGSHAGDEQIMQQTIELAIENNVFIGAHPSFPDRENFGRTNMHLPAEKIYDIVKAQIELLQDLAFKKNSSLHHVKPHGALYNMAANDEILAAAICKAIISIDPLLLVYELSGSKFISVAESMGLKAYHEVFADRSYQEDGTLTPRSQPNALLNTEQEVAAQVKQFVDSKSVTTTNGKTLPLKVDTICIHGDGAQALRFAQIINQVVQA